MNDPIPDELIDECEEETTEIEEVDRPLIDKIAEGQWLFISTEP